MDTPLWLEAFLKWVGAAVTIGTPVIGGWHYFKSRTYAVKLESKVTGELLSASEGETYLRILASLKNIGSSGVSIKPDESYIRICAATPSNSDLDVVERSRLRTLDVFENHHWLEAAENVEDSALIKIPKDNYLAFHIELGVVSKGLPSLWEGRLIWRGREWTSTAFINCELKPNDANSIEQTS